MNMNDIIKRLRHFNTIEAVELISKIVTENRRYELGLIELSALHRFLDKIVKENPWIEEPFKDNMADIERLKSEIQKAIQLWNNEPNALHASVQLVEALKELLNSK